MAFGGFSWGECLVSKAAMVPKPRSEEMRKVTPPLGCSGNVQADVFVVLL